MEHNQQHSVEIVEINLMDDAYPVKIDKRTPSVGGSFWYDNPPRIYSPYVHFWLYQQLLTFPHAVLLDVGASTGCYGLLAKHHHDLTVYAFEPAALAAEIQRENIRLNELEARVSIHELGVSNYNGRGIFRQLKDTGGLGVSMLDGVPREDKDCEDIPMEVITLDTFCVLKGIVPTAIKIDTEGGELRVLQGAKGIIAMHHPIIVAEAENANCAQYGVTAEDTKAWLEALDYEVTNPFGSDWLAIPKQVQ